MPALYTLTKKERLFLRDRVEMLFSHGAHFFVYPYRVVYYFVPEESLPLRVSKNAADTPATELLISIPKRRLRHAVDRNRSKRVTREAYRLHKAELLHTVSERGQHLLIALMQVSDTPLNYGEASSAIRKILRILTKESQKRKQINQ